MKTILLFNLLIFPFFVFGQWNQVGQNIEGNTSYSLFSTTSLTMSLNENGSVVAISTGISDKKVTIYELINNIWIQKGQILESVNQDTFGHSISISANGNIISIGSPQDDFNGTLPGYVKVYNYNGSSWVQEGNTIIENQSNENSFGAHIEISSDGLNLLIISYIDEVGLESTVMRVYKIINQQWVQQGNTITNIFSGSLYNYSNSYSINDNGSIVSTRNINTSTNSFNKINIFSLVSNNWNSYEITNINSFNNASISSLDFNSNGTRLVIGVEDDVNLTGTSQNNGSIRVYEKSNNQWNQIGNTIFGDNYEQLGRDVSINNIGNKILGSPLSVNNITQNKKIKVYEYKNNNWFKIGSDIINTSNVNGGLGANYAKISKDGNRVSIIDPNAIINNQQLGYLKIYEFSDELSVLRYDINDNFKLYPNPAKNTVNISSPQQSITNIDVYDIRGRIILTTKIENQLNYQLDISNLDSAFYFVKITTNTSTSIKRFIKI